MRMIITAAVGSTLLLGGCSIGSNAYAGEDLAKDVTNVLTKTKNFDVTDVECDDTPQIAPGKITDCTYRIDYRKSTTAGVSGKSKPQGVRVVWDDDAGHFHLENQVL